MKTSIDRMRRTANWLLLTVILVVATTITSALYPAQVVASTRTPSAECEASAGQPVPGRGIVRLVEPCATITGRVVSIRAGRLDGPARLMLELDPAYRPMLNGLNKIAQQGRMTVEVACARPANESGLAACNGIADSITLPQVGERVRVTGSYVFDPVLLGRIGWMEINPATRIEALAGQEPGQPAA